MMLHQSAVPPRLRFAISHAQSYDLASPPARRSQASLRSTRSCECSKHYGRARRALFPDAVPAVLNTERAEWNNNLTSFT
jgi:hypothetical protein